MQLYICACMYNVYALNNIEKYRLIKIEEIAERNKNHSNNRD